MTQALLAAAVIVCINSGYALAALAAASRCGIALSLSRGAPLALLTVGTVVECVLVLREPGAAAQALLAIGCGAVVAAAASDAACGYVFDAVTLPCIALMLLASAALNTAEDVAVGALACAGTLYALYVITRGRGLGLGDVKLALCIGGCTGMRAGIETLGAAFVIGGAYAAVLLATKRAARGQELRFAPYLAAGMAAVMLLEAPQ